MVGKPIFPKRAKIGFTRRQKFIGLINKKVLICQFVNIICSVLNAENLLETRVACSRITVRLLESGVLPSVFLNQISN